MKVKKSPNWDQTIGRKRKSERMWKQTTDAKLYCCCCTFAMMNEVTLWFIYPGKPKCSFQSKIILERKVLRWESRRGHKPQTTKCCHSHKECWLCHNFGHKITLKPANSWPWLQESIFTIMRIAYSVQLQNYCSCSCFYWWLSMFFLINVVVVVVVVIICCWR